MATITGVCINRTDPTTRALPHIYCTAVNSYITPAMQQQGRWSLPRQPGAVPLTTAHPAVTGVSSFAFQGTNAHALLAAAPAGSGILNPQCASWQRSSFWLLPPQYDLVQAVRMAGQVALFVANLQQPAAAALLQARAGPGSASILTLGAAIELVAEAAAQLAAAAVAPVGSTNRLLSAIAVSHVALPTGRPGPTVSIAVMQVALAVASGSFELQLLDSRSATRCSSGLMSASAALCSAASSAAQSAPGSRAVAEGILGAFVSATPPPVATVSQMAADPLSPLHTVAVRPAAVDSALQLIDRLAAAAEACLVSGMAPLGFSSVASSSQGVSLAGDSGAGMVRLLGIATSSPASISTQQATAADHGLAALENNDDFLYSVVWEVAAPQPAESTGATNRQWMALAAGLSAAASTANAMSVAQAAKRLAPGGTFLADLHGCLVPVPPPASAAAANREAAEAAAAMHGILKALAQEAPDMSMAVFGEGGRSQLGGPWSIAIAAQDPAGIPPQQLLPDVHGQAFSCRTLFSPRLQSRQQQHSRSSGRFVKPVDSLDGSYVITGGSGVLAGVAALWLLQQGAASVLLLSRSGSVPGSLLSRISTAQQPWGATLSRVSASKADVALRADMDALRIDRSDGTREHTGLLHAGGVLADATISNQTLAGVYEVGGALAIDWREETVASAFTYHATVACLQVLAPKQAALSNLLRHASPLPLERQLLFSSVAALLGSPGQANYSAANATLDAAAQQAQQAGLPACSIQWGAWAGAGMAAHDANTAARMERLGMGLISAGGGLQALAFAMHSAGASDGMGALAAVPFRWRQFVAAARKPLQPLFADVASEQAADMMPSIAALASSLPRVEAAAVAAAVQDAVRSILGTDVGPNEPLMAAGLDSLGAVELKNSLESRLAVQLPSTLVFDYPTTAALSEFLIAKLAPAGSASAVPASTVTVDSLSWAVPGMSPPVAGSAAAATVVMLGASWSSPQQALSQLAVPGGGQDAVGLVPLDRWDVEADPLAARFGAYLADIAAFDAAAFSISDAETALMDPQQRLLLEAVGEVLMGSAVDPLALAPLRARGVYVGERACCLCLMHNTSAASRSLTQCTPHLSMQALLLLTMAAWWLATPSAASTMPPPLPCRWPAAGFRIPLACAAPASALILRAQRHWWACIWLPRACRQARHSYPMPMVSPICVLKESKGQQQHWCTPFGFK